MLLIALRLRLAFSRSIIESRHSTSSPHDTHTLKHTHRPGRATEGRGHSTTRHQAANTRPSVLCVLPVRGERRNRINPTARLALFPAALGLRPPAAAARAHTQWLTHPPTLRSTTTHTGTSQQSVRHQLPPRPHHRSLARPPPARGKEDRLPARPPSLCLSTHHAPSHRTQRINSTPAPPHPIPHTTPHTGIDASPPPQPSTIALAAHALLPHPKAK